MNTVTSLKEIFSWFSKGKTPTEEQFKNTFSSFWHKSERIPQTQIEGLLEWLDSVSSHNKLKGREEADCHPMESISGLTETIGDIGRILDYINGEVI